MILYRRKKLGSRKNQVFFLKKMETPDVLAYTVYTRSGKDAESKRPVACGIFVTKEEAEKAMKTEAETYCLQQYGLKLYVANQLGDPKVQHEKKKTIKDLIIGKRKSTRTRRTTLDTNQRRN